VGPVVSVSEFAVVDFNGDGAPDILVTDSGGSSLLVVEADP
jgi:hypothetical protein